MLPSPQDPQHMALTPSQRPTREWPLLILTMVIVGLVCYPFLQMVGTDQSATWSSWTPERWARLLLGPEQIACYCCFVWGLMIFFNRFWEMRRQGRAFGLNMLPTDEGARILQEDA